MKNLIVITALLIFFSSCKSTQSIKQTRDASRVKVETKTIDVNTEFDLQNSQPNSIDFSAFEIIEDTISTSNNIIDYAKQFDGVRYKFGGTSKAGMDCSGLVYTAFKAFDISLPRISRDMAKEGVDVSLAEIQEGDLVFFRTNPRRKEISHVGIVVTSRIGMIEFIHASTQAGVIISSLAERYWHNSFVKAKRVL